MGWPFRNLAFEGGGVWGVAYGGAMAALEEAGALELIERVAGTSAGAIAALAVALRFDALRIRKILRDLQFDQFLADASPLNFAERFGWYSTGPMQRWFEALIRDASPNFPNSEDFTGQETFADLRRAGCRDLVVFATNLNRRRSTAFSAAETPAVRVVDALRASVAIPGFFQAVELTVNGDGPHIYVDGGVLINYPIMAFDQGRPEKRTIGFKFRKPGQAQNAPPAELQYGQVREWARLLYDTLTNERNELLRRSPVYLQRTTFIDVGDVSPIDFDLDDWRKNLLMESGYEATRAFLRRWKREHGPLGILRWIRT